MALQVKTDKGWIKGVDCGDHIEFRGVPYAAPPVGDLRWRAPRGIEAWKGVRRADHFAPTAMQEKPEADNPFTGKYYREFYHDPEFTFPMSEDCLYLNIWVPTEKKEEKLPVAFWIHGGGFSSGFSSEMEFDGAAYCRKGVILVSSDLTGERIRKAVMQSGVSCGEDIFTAPSLREAEELGERFVPNVDGYVLKKAASQVWERGEMKKIPYLLGTVRGDLADTEEETVKGTPGILINECIRWSLKCEEMNIPSYVYYFCHKLPGPDWNYFHSSELWYIFGTFERCWRPMTEEDRDLSEKMVTYWTDFMKYGAPSPDRKEDWMPCTKGSRYIKRLE